MQSSGFLACFLGVLVCSFCHPMQEETFWESYLLRKVRQFTAQGCFEPYVVLIQFWKSFIPTPLHGNKESICDIFWKKTSKLLSFGFLACLFPSFGCSFCHPMQEEAFWECYLLRKVGQFTAQGCFESYFVLIQFWKSFIPTPLHGNKESIHILEKKHQNVSVGHCRREESSSPPCCRAGIRDWWQFQAWQGVWSCRGSACGRPQVSAAARWPLCLWAFAQGDQQGGGEAPGGWNTEPALRRWPEGEGRHQAEDKITAWNSCQAEPFQSISRGQWGRPGSELLCSVRDAVQGGAGSQGLASESKTKSCGEATKGEGETGCEEGPPHCLCFSSFGCSFCHPMQEETFWESYLFRKVRKFTAQSSFESYFALIQFWKSFTPTPLHGNKESICYIFWKETSNNAKFWVPCLFFRVLVAVSVIQCKKRPFESLIWWERWGSLLPRVVLSLMLFLFNFGSRLSRRRSMGTKRAYVTYFGKKTSKLLSFGFLACFCSSFGCSFCHPMQEEAFWECYLLRKVRQFTA